MTFFLSGLLASLAIDIHPPALVAIFILASLDALSPATRWKRIGLISAGLLLGVVWWHTMHVEINRPFFFKQWAAFNGAIYKGQPGSYFAGELNRYWQFFWEGAYHRNMIWLALFINAIYNAWIHYQPVGCRKLLAAIAAILISMAFFVPNKLGYVSYVMPFLMILSAFYLRWLWQKSRLTFWIWVVPIALLMAGENAYKLWAFRDADFKGYLAKIYDAYSLGQRIEAEDLIKKGMAVPVEGGFARRTTYGPSILLYGLMDKRYYPDHNHMWDPILHKDTKGERLISTLEKIKPQYIILDEGMYPIQTKPWTERAYYFREYVAKRYEKVSEFKDKFYGRDWYNVRPQGEFITEIWRRQ